MSEQLDELLNEVGNVVQASNAQTAASQALAQEVAGKMGELDAKADEVVGRVNDAIPTAVSDQMWQTLYLDPVNGSDENTGTSAAQFKTLKAAIDSVPVGGTAVIRVDNNAVIDIDEIIRVVNKNIVFRGVDATFNANARIELYKSSFKSYYSLLAINQTSDCVFYHFSADIRISCRAVNPTGDATHLFLTHYTGGETSTPGSHHSVALFSGTVSDAADTYYVFGATFRQSSMIVTTYSLTLGTNVDLIDPIFHSLQVGSKGVYLLGA
ncbi:hypothetical protein [Shewanella sp. 10N.286.54.B9]|uniref:hypothetical protein n=1 Tax=Shewanella sp. 10N.286.54.B9 TaxID=3229719 RepID=UPI0035539CE4